MNKKNKETGVEINCKTDKQVISSGKECTRILELGITAPVVETKTAKPLYSLGNFCLLLHDLSVIVLLA